MASFFVALFFQIRRFLRTFAALNRFGKDIERHEQRKKVFIAFICIVAVIW